MGDDIMLYKDTATGIRIRPREPSMWSPRAATSQGVTLRDLASELGDPDGVVVVGEWGLWNAVQSGRWERLILSNLP